MSKVYCNDKVDNTGLKQKQYNLDKTREMKSSNFINYIKVTNNFPQIRVSVYIRDKVKNMKSNINS